MTTKTRTTRRRAATATRHPGRAAMEQAALPTGGDLLKALAIYLRAHKVATVRRHPDGKYARVSKDGRTLAYLVPRRRAVAVYVNALAKAVPDGVSFTRVPLGSHHFGRGEVVLSVDGPGDHRDVARALAAAAKNPVPRKPRA